MLGGSFRAFSRCERPADTASMGGGAGAVVLGCSGGGGGCGWGCGAIILAPTVLQITEVLALSELSADMSILLNLAALSRGYFYAKSLLFFGF